MSAGVADQRMKGQGTPVTNVSKEQLESPGEELAESWRHQQQAAASYAPPISSATDPYSAAGYYGTAGTAAFPYQTFGVGDGTWSANGTDPMTVFGGYAQPDTYGMEGVFGPSTTPFSTTFGQPASATFNYFHGNGDYSTWGGQLSRAKQYDDYYRPDGLYVPDGLKAVEAGVQGLALNDSKLEKDIKPQQHEQKETSGQPKKTWATIASQPAKPQPPMQSSGLKKKGPGMPPPPIIPGKHNMDIGTWETKSNGPSVAQPPPQPPPPKPQPVQQPVVVSSQQQQQQQQPPPGPLVAAQPPWSGSAPPRAPPPRPPTQLMLPPVPMPSLPPPPAMQPQTATNHPVLDKLRTKNNYNPTDFDLSARDARFFVIKSYSEDDIHRSIKYEIWCSTEHGNKRLDSAYRERTKDGNGVVFLFFSVNGSGHFCGMAQMMSPVDYKNNSSVWAQDKWKGQFKVRWIYVKDVPNMQLRHIRLENNENKPVTNSRDTQEIPHARGIQVLRLMHGYRHSTSIFDDFIHYEKRQEEEDMRKAPENQSQGREGHHGYEGKHHQGYEKHDSYSGGNKGHYRDHGAGFNRDHGGYSKDHGHSGGFHKDHGFQKDQGGNYNKDHGNSDGYGGGGGYKGHRGGGDREHGGGGYREHRDQSGGGYRSHHSMPKERGEGSSRGGRGRGRPN